MDLEKGMMYLNRNTTYPPYYYGYDWNKIESLIEMDVVANLQELLKQYTRNEFFENMEEIAEKLKEKIKGIVRKKTGYEIAALSVFELNR